MKRPIFQTIFEQKSDFCEKSSKMPVETMIPGQAIKISELVVRYDRGQRLNVHANFPAGSNFDNITDEEALRQIQNEVIDENMFPSDDVHDLVDVQREYEAQEARKAEFAEKIKKKRSPQAPPQDEAPQDPKPDDPAK